MKVLSIPLIVLLFSSTTVMAAVPSEDSIKQLMEVTHMKQLADRMRPQLIINQFNGLFDKAIQPILHGSVPNAKQQQAIENMKTKMVLLFQDQLSWSKLEPVYIRVYQKTFTEEEVEAMLSFYKTPAGQAVINKTPTMMQMIQTEMPKLLMPPEPQIHKILEELSADLEAARN